VLGLAGPFGFGTTFAPTTGPWQPMDFDDNPLTTDRDQFDYMSRQVAAHPELALGGPSVLWVKAALEETAALMKMPAPDVPTADLGRHTRKHRRGPGHRGTDGRTGRRAA
jgi:lysophospholipase